MTMTGICESCHLRPTTHVLRFGDTAVDLPFLVCDSCAEAARGYYGVTEPYDPTGDDAA